MKKQSIIKGLTKGIAVVGCWLLVVGIYSCVDNDDVPETMYSAKKMTARP